MRTKMAEGLVTGYYSFDEQHRELIDLIDDFCSGITAKRRKGEIVMAMEFLDNYFTAHMNNEEIVMQKHNYPDYDRHKAEHDLFKKSFASYKSEIITCERIEDWAGEEGLKSLLMVVHGKHIKTEDIELANFVNVKARDSYLTTRFTGLGA